MKGAILNQETAGKSTGAQAPAKTASGKGI
jgi:hypothetical protein